MSTKQPLTHPVKRVNSTARSYVITAFISTSSIALIGLYGAYYAGCIYLSIPIIACLVVAYISLIKLLNTTWRMPAFPETKTPEVNVYYPYLMEKEL